MPRRVIEAVLLTLIFVGNISVAQRSSTSQTNLEVQTINQSRRSIYNSDQTTRPASTLTQITYYADRYCATPGTYDQSCLVNAISAVGNNAHIILSPHLYLFTSQVVASGLLNVFIDGPGAIIQMDGNAFKCTSCIGGGISNIIFNSTTVPIVVSCTFVPSTEEMNCPSLPRAGVLAIDPWGRGIGHITSEDDSSLLLSGQTLSLAQQTEFFDTGVEYINSTNGTITGLSGTYFHIDLLSSSNFIISHNNVMGGTGVTPETSEAGGNMRCGAICIWALSPAPDTFPSSNNKVIDNTITYAASRSIALIGTSSTTVSDNYMEYAGEGGVVMGEGEQFYSTHSIIVHNTARHSSFDGFDINSNFGTQGFVTDQIVDGNTSSYNFHTGFIGNGINTQFTNNHADHNVNSGFTLDFQGSLISNNYAYDNVTGNFTNGQIAGQLLVGTDTLVDQATVFGNTITNNHAILDSDVTVPYGQGIAVQSAAVGAPSIFSGNYITGGGRTIAINTGCPTCAQIVASNNYDDINGTSISGYSPTSGTPAMTLAFGTNQYTPGLYSFSIVPNIIASGAVGWDQWLYSSSHGKQYLIRWDDLGRTTIPSLAGSGNVPACIDANGMLYRGTTGICP